MRLIPKIIHTELNEITGRDIVVYRIGDIYKVAYPRLLIDGFTSIYCNKEEDWQKYIDEYQLIETLEDESHFFITTLSFNEEPSQTRDSYRDYYMDMASRGALKI